MTAPTNPQKGTTVTELAIPEQHNTPAVAAVPGLPDKSPFAVEASPIAVWAHEADLAYQLADKLSTTSFVPASMRGRTGDIAGCIIAGKELGLSPMVALKSMDVIQGTPALRVHAMRALLQSHGHEIELVESTDAVCRMRGRRKGSEKWQEVVWPIARAQQMGLLNKDQWKKQPKTMLTARATGEICRLVASDALHGMGYNTAELSDTQTVVMATQVGAPATAAEILARRSSPAPLQPGPAAELDAATDGESAEAEFTDEASAAPLNGWQLAWQAVGVAVSPLGWDQAKAKAEFTQYMNMELEHSSVDDLQTFTEHVQTLVAAEGGAE